MNLFLSKLENCFDLMAFLSCLLLHISLYFWLLSLIYDVPLLLFKVFKVENVLNDTPPIIPSWLTLYSSTSNCFTKILKLRLHIAPFLCSQKNKNKNKNLKGFFCNSSKPKNLNLVQWIVALWWKSGALLSWDKSVPLDWLKSCWVRLLLINIPLTNNFYI